MTYIFRSRSFAPPCGSIRAAAKLLRLSTLFALVILTNFAFAQDLASLDKVLVPVLNLKPITGANGSTFLTLLNVYTQNRGTVGFYPAMLSVNQVVKGPVYAQTDSQLLNPQFWEGVPVSKGRFFYFEKNRPDVAITLNVTATAPDLSTADTPLPLVRELDVLTGRVEFVGLPITPFLNGPPNPYPT